MSASRKMLPDLKPDKLQAARDLFSRLQLGYGFFALVAVLAALSFIAVYEWQPVQHIYAQGEVAEVDIASPMTFSFQDAEATRLRREAVSKAQPLICVLNLEPVERLHQRVTELFIDVNKAESPADMEALRLAVSDEIGEEISLRLFALLLEPEVQALAGNSVLPWLEQRMREGLVSDARAFAGYPGGLVVRDLASGEITSRMAIMEVTDVRNAMLDLSVHVRNLPTTAQAKRLLTTLFSGFITATLTPNFEATAQNAAEAARLVRPVVQQVMAGEIIVRQGERISQEQLGKLNALWGYESDNFNPELFLGIFLCSALLCSGLFYTASFNGSNNLYKFSQKDFLFIAFLLASFTVLAKGFFLLGTALTASTPAVSAGAQAFAVPIAGAAGLAVMVSSSRRYFITCLLLSLFCTLVNKGGIALYLFYFISSMFGAWLIADIQARKEVGKTLFILLPGLILIWLAATLVQGGEPERFTSEFIAVLLGGFLSMTLVFAMSPLIELMFGFTTRFSLMELMNQEHPVLRQLMFDAPGTYHHSLIVSTMVEVAAKSIGANSLLCKVAALYHDIGKVEKPHYFVENQFRIANPHDKLTPTMSALVLISHVKRGVELAQKYRLGKEITDIIREHHGNRVIHYFYQKAQQQAQNQQGGQSVQLEDFCYYGPRPQSREAALIMLADVVEASSRTLDDPTPSRIKTHVHRMIRSVFADGQLNAVDMTFKDLEQVEDSFTLILIGMFHKRIEYPGKALPKAEQHALPIGFGQTEAAGRVEGNSSSSQSDDVAKGAADDATSVGTNTAASMSDSVSDAKPDSERDPIRPDNEDDWQAAEDYPAAQWLEPVEKYDELLRGKNPRKNGN